MNTACSSSTPNLSQTDYLIPTTASGVKDMMVAPNKSKIRARVLEIEQSAQFRDRWNLKIEILMIQSVQGGIFAEVGQTVQASTIAAQLSFKQNDTISAEAEYMGNPQGGLFRLTQIQVEQ